MLWPDRGPGVFEQEVAEIEDALLLTTVEKAVAWAQSNSVWPDTFGLACCAMEMIAVVSSRYDIARFGMERFSSSPRQADLLIVSGRVTHKMAPPLRQVYDQMLEPKWVIAMGACASSGGMFNNYTILQGVDKIVPVDVHVPGCPPRPEALLEGVVRLHEKIRAAFLPRTRSVESPSDRMRRSWRRRDARVVGETTLVVDPARLVEACLAPPRRARLQRPERHHARRLPRLGRAGRRRLHRHGRRAATSTRPALRDSRAFPRRSRSGSRSRTTSSASSDDPVRVRVQVWLDDGEPVASVLPSGPPPTGSSARPGT